jgi:hypothetical protein
VTNTNDAGPGSLRAAILGAVTGTALNPDLIRFAIPASDPRHYYYRDDGIRGQVTLGNVTTTAAGDDGTIGDIDPDWAHSWWATQPASALPPPPSPVTIDGTSQPGYAGTPRIALDGRNAGPSTNGLSITAGSSTVKGLVISSFGSNGVQLQGLGGNLLAGNYIGTDPSGTRALGNGNRGVVIFGVSNNTIGGSMGDGTGNVISANAGDGVALLFGANTNHVQGNYIGTRAGGDRRLGNGAAGVSVYSASGNTIGGNLSDGTANVVSANGVSDDPLGGDSGVEVWGGATNNHVQGNYIGTDASGTRALGNGIGGVFISDASGNTVGGNLSDGTANVISGNTLDGVGLTYRAARNYVQGNYIGTNATGTQPLGNGADGVAVYSASDNTIGGNMLDGTGNVISANGVSDEAFVGHSGVALYAGASGNLVQGNYIGTDVNGAVRLGNAGDGVLLSAALNNTIGGLTSNDQRFGNLISANLMNGVKLTDGASNNRAQGNSIGTDVNGTQPLGNTLDGVYLDATSNTIGATASGAGNLISANGRNGVGISRSGPWNYVEGNSIGTDKDGADPNMNMGNRADGVLVAGANNDLIQYNKIGFNRGNGVYVRGGSNNGISANTISSNANDGVLVDTGTGNRISANSISSHAHLGIELINNGNNNQAAPMLTPRAIVTTISGTLRGAPNTTFALEFFSNANCNPLGGEGQTYLDWTSVTTNGTGSVSFNHTFTVALDPSQPFITATAIDPANNTSEFSQCVPGASPGGPTARLGSDTLDGGPGEGILAGGSTVYDNNSAELAAFLADTALKPGALPAFITSGTGTAAGDLRGNGNRVSGSSLIDPSTSVFVDGPAPRAPGPFAYGAQVPPALIEPGGAGRPGGPPVSEAMATDFLAAERTRSGVGLIDQDTIWLADRDPFEQTIPGLPGTRLTSPRR